MHLSRIAPVAKAFVELGKPLGQAIPLGVLEPILIAIYVLPRTSLAMQEAFWSLRFGMVTGRFGVPWMVNCEKPR